MGKYLIIDKTVNCCGTGYGVQVEIDGLRTVKRWFYGYSLKEAVRVYRNENGLKGRHFTTVYLF